MSLSKKQNLRLNDKTHMGFSLVETIIYISLMTAVLFSLIALISSASDTYLILKSSRDVEKSAISIMNNLSSVSGKASTIDITGTVFDSATGSISLLTYDSVGNSSSSKIYLQNGQVILSQNNVVVGALNLSDTKVTSLIFRNMSTSTFNGFKVELQVDNSSSSVSRYIKESFYNSYILR